MQLQGKVSTNSEKKKQSMKKELKKHWTEGANHSPLKGDELQLHQLCTVRLPSFSPRLLRAPAREPAAAAGLPMATPRKPIKLTLPSHEATIGKFL